MKRSNMISKTLKPLVWTEEKLGQLADEFLDFVITNEDCLFVRTFCVHKRMLYQTLQGLLPASEKLRTVYGLARDILADRFHAAALTGKINVTYALRIAHFVDDDLAQHELEHQKALTRSKLDGISESKISGKRYRS